MLYCRATREALKPKAQAVSDLWHGSFSGHAGRIYPVGPTSVAIEQNIYTNQFGKAVNKNNACAEIIWADRLAVWIVYPDSLTPPIDIAVSDACIATNPST
jgi:uncharacterized membrane protein